MTHTVATLEATPSAFDEITAKLRAAGYSHLFMLDGSIDMSGIALAHYVKTVAPHCTCGQAFPPHRCEVHPE